MFENIQPAVCRFSMSLGNNDEPVFHLPGENTLPRKISLLPVFQTGAAEKSLWSASLGSVTLDQCLKKFLMCCFDGLQAVYILRYPYLKALFPWVRGDRDLCHGIERVHNKLNCMRSLLSLYTSLLFPLQFPQKIIQAFSFSFWKTIFLTNTQIEAQPFSMERI
jgi:hypothetical protein